MAIISSKNDSKENPVSSSSSKSKLKQKKSKSEFKRKMAEQRLMDLTNTLNNIGDSVCMDIIRYQPTENLTSDISSSAMERAEDVQRNLPKKFPSFVKLMLRSHVTQGFWLGLPNKFCRDYLPKNDEKIVLVDSNEKGYDTKYLAGRTGLSGGWRGFSIEHNLLEGDVVIFHLIEPCKFKLYIVRARRLTEVDGAMSLVNLDSHPEPIKALKMEEPQENANIIETKTRNKYPNPLVQDNNNNQKKKKKTKKNIPTTSDDAEMADGIKFSESRLDFKDVNCFQDFSIHLDGGLVIDSEVPRHQKKKYYDLCRSQNTFLHENLVRGLNTKLAAGIISETINIADAIRASTTPHEHLESWDKTLKAFEDLGMSVGPLRARIREMMSLYRDSRARIELMRKERAEAEGVMKELSERLSNVKTCVEKYDAIIDDLNARNEGLGSKFEEIACAPW
ncbi:hypothetical protein ABFX02_08G108400 [Erythranthe guttata]